MSTYIKLLSNQVALKYISSFLKHGKGMISANLNNTQAKCMTTVLKTMLVNRFSWLTTGKVTAHTFKQINNIISQIVYKVWLAFAR